MHWLVIGAGGALGAMARHGLNHVIHQRQIAGTFPTGILLINVLGSVAIGAIAGLLASNRIAMSSPMRMFVIVGFLGGFTTFSSFSLDTLALVRGGHLSQAILNVVGQVVLSLVGVWIGFRAAGGG